jgi:Na+/H+ antiporter NhaC
VNIFNLKDFNNSGTLVSDSSTTQSIGIENQSTWDTLENSGTIMAVSRADAASVSRAAAAVIGVGTAVNSGLIAAYSASGVASGVDAGALTNSATSGSCN